MKNKGNPQFLIHLQQSALCTAGTLESLGLKYGIPRFIPLKIKISPITTANTGTARLIFLLISILINFPNNVAANITGTVPKPNSAINKAPDRRLPVATAPAIPI